MKLKDYLIHINSMCNFFLCNQPEFWKYNYRQVKAKILTGVKEMYWQLDPKNSRPKSRLNEKRFIKLRLNTICLQPILNSLLNQSQPLSYNFKYERAPFQIMDITIVSRDDNNYGNSIVVLQVHLLMTLMSKI